MGQLWLAEHMAAQSALMYCPSLSFLSAWHLLAPELPCHQPAEVWPTEGVTQAGKVTTHPPHPADHVNAPRLPYL